MKVRRLSLWGLSLVLALSFGCQKNKDKGYFTPPNEAAPFIHGAATAPAEAVVEKSLEEATTGKAENLLGPQAQEALREGQEIVQNFLRPALKMEAHVFLRERILQILQTAELERDSDVGQILAPWKESLIQETIELTQAKCFMFLEQVLGLQEIQMSLSELYAFEQHRVMEILEQEVLSFQIDQGELKELVQRVSREFFIMEDAHGVPRARRDPFAPLIHD